jgi:4-diphosphocytidyl-2-C-methyl-D-erythritol kinase
MNLRQSESARTVPAPAKLNLLLDVLGRRDDGYHELETLMVPVCLYDSLSLVPTPAVGHGRPGEITLDIINHVGRVNEAEADAQVPTGPDNLVVRALELLRQRSGCELGAHVRLVKRIAAAAGLGGGSSDAAAALGLGNREWGLNWNHERLASVAAELGSDVPFFIFSGAAICRGCGERIEQIPRITPLHVVIVKPPHGLGTADVYRTWDDLNPFGTDPPIFNRDRRRLPGLVAALRQGNLTDLGQWMGNQLQAAAAKLSPWVERAQAAFAGLDFLAHQLTGSGTAYFGVCRHAQHARRLASILRTRQLGLVFVTQNCR